MASTCMRSMTRTSLSAIKSHISKSKAAAFARSASFIKGSATSASSPNRRFASIARLPVELGCGSLYPLHSAVAAARLTSRLSTASHGCRDLSQGTLCRTYPGL